MSNECKIIMSLLKDYIKLKEDYKEYNKENLFDVFAIFNNEINELADISSFINLEINSMKNEGYSYISSTKEIITEQEEDLLNEIADVLLTTARLIKEFKLEEPLTEMIEYKYERQKSRELKRFNNE